VPTRDEATVKLTRLRNIIRDLGSVLVCYSGGIDSALVLAVAHQELGPERAIGMTALSPSLAESERAAAEIWATKLGATHRFVHSQELNRPDYVKNGPDRCFHCKTELYAIARQKATAWALSSIANGTNLDDLGDYRPGLKAATEAQIRSPLCEAELNKDDVRAIAHLLDMPIWDKPASACLASRIPYGTSVTFARLRQVERLESSLRALGFLQVRVRHHEDIARIEVPSPELARLVSPEVSKMVDQAGRDAGYKFVTVDIRGYRTGSLNEVLSTRSLPLISS
jgi:pyridinium-3,5-biscarboxylic acid mononucleotide sulfurtransferase